MAGFHLAVIPVGKVDPAEVEHALSRAAKVLRTAVELRSSLPVPQGVEDTDRHQFRAALLLSRLRARVPQLKPGKLIGWSGPQDDSPQPQTDGHLFVTDVDLFTAKTDGVFAALNVSQQSAVVSLRRLRESFYRRKADPAKQRSRLTKEILRMAARLQGGKECPDPKCVLAHPKMLVDLDIRDEAFCRVCSRWLFRGTIRI